jgi:hypothetical protein
MGQKDCHHISFVKSRGPNQSIYLWKGLIMDYEVSFSWLTIRMGNVFSLLPQCKILHSGWLQVSTKLAIYYCLNEREKKFLHPAYSPPVCTVFVVEIRPRPMSSLTPWPTPPFLYHV